MIRIDHHHYSFNSLPHLHSHSNKLSVKMNEIHLVYEVDDPNPNAPGPSSSSPSGNSDEKSILDLTFTQKIAIGSGHFVNDITASIWFSYFLMYSEEIVGLSTNTAAILMLIGQVSSYKSTSRVLLH